MIRAFGICFRQLIGVKMVNYIIQVKELRQFTIEAGSKVEAKNIASNMVAGKGHCFHSEVIDVEEV